MGRLEDKNSTQTSSKPEDKETQIRVLHADDDRGFLRSAKQMLELQGNFQVETATSVKETLKKLEGKDFDAVVSDYQMPDQDGLDFLRELQERGSQIPFIVFTGKGKEEVCMEALNLGADRYLRKGGTPETLYGELAHSIRKAVERCVVKKKLKAREETLEKGYTKNLELKVVAQDGHTVSVEMNVSLMRDRTGKPTGFVAVTRDITKRKQREQKLRREQEILETVTQNAGVGIGINSRNYRVLWINKFLKDIVGDVEGKRCYRAFAHRDDVCPGCGVKEIFETGKERVVHEQRVPVGDGRKVWLELTATPLRDQEGNITAALEVVVNITERKRKEKMLRESLERLRRLNEKLEVAGKMSRHDVRNKLSTVNNDVYLAKNRLQGEHPEVEKYLEDIKSSVDQTKRIFDFAKTYEQLGTQELQPMEVGRAVEKAVRRYADLEVEVKNECQGLTVEADRMLPRLFYNLIQNSLQHGGEELTEIRVYHRETGDGGLELVYEDDGVGIPEGEKGKVFQEGYGRGTGYGLYLIQKMCEVYGWSIRETGQHGLGAKFIITIPRKQGN